MLDSSNTGIANAMTEVAEVFFLDNAFKSHDKCIFSDFSLRCDGTPDILVAHLITDLIVEENQALLWQLAYQFMVF